MHKKLIPLLGNSQRLDGGAMFGNAPKALWEQWMPADEHNAVALVCRAMLIQEPGRNILFETGIGAFFPPKLKQRYGVQEDHHVLLDSLAEHGLTDADIDIIVLSHLHFDHAGGLLSAYTPDHKPSLLFPKAKILVSSDNWQRACNPHPRDQASFIPELHELLRDSGRLYLVSGEQDDLLGADYFFHYSHGHTPGLMMTEVQLGDSSDEPLPPFLKGGNAATGSEGGFSQCHSERSNSVIYVSDMIPGVPWVHVPITMGYDRSPELLVDEKREFLEYAVKHDCQLFLTHDPQVATAKIAVDDRGRFVVKV